MQKVNLLSAGKIARLIDAAFTERSNLNPYVKIYNWQLCDWHNLTISFMVLLSEFKMKCVFIVYNAINNLQSMADIDCVNWEWNAHLTLKSMEEKSVQIW